MSKNNERPKAKAPGGRPRDEQATDRILAVALELAEESGFDALTAEGVAARAGVGKMTIYRRWPNVWAVVVDAILAEVTRVSPVMERATARESLTVSMKLVAKSFRGRHGRLLRPLIGRAQVDDTLRAAIDERWLSPRRELSRGIVRRGIERGELRPSLDPDVVIDALYGPLYHRLLLPYGGTEVRLADTYIEALVDAVFGGIETFTKV
jgi:AcrR family transcriptional regulator